MSLQTKEQVLALCDALYGKKAQDIVAINVADKTIIADWFIIASGNSPLQVKAICDEADEKSIEYGLELRRKDGYNEGVWIVLDFSNILVHIFVPQERQYYNMERLWADADQENVIFYSKQKEEELAASQPKF